jgi:predicted ATPase with chaperone activity
MRSMMEMASVVTLTGIRRRSFSEFQRHVLEVLRERLENGAITISRAAGQAEFPARFQLIAAMNPCPCGNLGDATSSCHCTADQALRYRTRISGPLLDRLDLHVHVPRVEFKSLRGQSGGEASVEVAARVTRGREGYRCSAKEAVTPIWTMQLWNITAHRMRPAWTS